MTGTPTAREVLEHARMYVALGFSVFPVPPPGGSYDGKVPAISWQEFQHRHATAAELVAWFSGRPMNIAIVTGEISDLVVVDPDSLEALKIVTRTLPYTPWQTEPSKAFHLFYRHSGVRVPNQVRIVLNGQRIAADVRGDGGFVIAPPSLHAIGTRYRLAGDWTVPRESVPRFWPGWIAKPVPTVTRPSNRPMTGDVIERARRYLAAIPQPEIGQGSDVAVLSAACRLVRGFEIDEADAVLLLCEWAGNRPGWTQPWIASKVAHAIRYGTEPIGALR
jgi:hypothetical protein